MRHCLFTSLFCQKYYYICQTTNNTTILNYLAHIFLSGNHSEIQIGNFIGDFVKGSKYNLYPPEIRFGILFHRKIDEFTDKHPVVIQVNNLLKPTFGRYSAIISDMYFDYFLARNFKKYSTISLGVFALRFYFFALFYYKYLPNRVRGFIFHFIFTNRLKKYGSLDGLKQSLEIMAHFKVKAIQPEKTISFLMHRHDQLEAMFFDFFEELIVFCKLENK